MRDLPGQLHHFLLLDGMQQAQATRRMANTGWSDSSIAAATRLSVEQIRRILAKPHPATSERNPC